MALMTWIHLLVLFSMLWLMITSINEACRENKKEEKVKNIYLCKESEDFVRKTEYFHQQQLESLGRLSSGIAHDFNNILSVIAGYVAMIEKKQSKEKRDEYLSAVLAMTEKGSKLTRQLLAFGRQNITSDESCELNTAIDNQMIMLKTLMGENNKINVINCKGEHWISADEQMVWQIIMNVASNARDAMPEGGVFTIETKKPSEKGMVSLLLSDTGCGMDKKTQCKIFDPFFTTKETGKGTGLGLSMVYGLVTQLGGNVHIQSVVGNGTTICIDFPPERLEQYEKRLSVAQPKESCSQKGNLTLEDKTIMVVDDEPQLSLVLTAMLEQLGLNVLSAGSANEALVIQDEYEGHIDFLLSDMVMPEMNGNKLVELFSSLRRETNILLMTGYPLNKEDTSTSLDVPNGVPLIYKPFSVDELRDKLQGVLTGDEIKLSSNVAI